MYRQVLSGVIRSNAVILLPYVAARRAAEVACCFLVGLQHLLHLPGEC